MADQNTPDAHTEDVNTSQHEDSPPAQRKPGKVCQIHCNLGIKCSDCHIWVHYLCSEIPTYVLINLTKFTPKYACMTCIKENYPNYNDLCSHIEKYKTEERVLDNTTVNNQVSQEVGSTSDLGLGSTPENTNLSLLAATHLNTVSNMSQSTLIVTNNQISDCQCYPRLHLSSNGGRE